MVARLSRLCALVAILLALTAPALARAQAAGAAHAHGHAHVEFNLRSVKDGNWSDPKTWSSEKVPAAGDRVLVTRGTKVLYDVKSTAALRLVQIVGSLTFARDRDTLLSVGVLKVQNSDECSESGFACDFEGANAAGEPQAPRQGAMPTLEIGTLENPIPAEHTAKIRLHFLEGMDKNDAPAIVCCSARMELHGAPPSRTWVKLGENAAAGETSVVLSEPVTGWKVGDEIIVTASKKMSHRGSYRSGDSLGTEERTIAKIDGQTIHFEK